jgi:ribulose bisphosphate carboxylase small subunit
MKITLVSHGETITFVKNPGLDIWKVLSTNGAGRKNLTKKEVDEQVQELLDKGFELA